MLKIAGSLTYFLRCALFYLIVESACNSALKICPTGTRQFRKNFLCLHEVVLQAYVNLPTSVVLIFGMIFIHNSIILQYFYQHLENIARFAQICNENHAFVTFRFSQVLRQSLLVLILV